MMTYVLAERRVRLESNAITGGMYRAPTMAVPGGVEHAATADETATLCGIPARSLEAFPGVTFGVGNPDTKCRTCLELAENPAG